MSICKQTGSVDLISTALDHVVPHYLPRFIYSLAAMGQIVEVGQAFASRAM